MPNDSPPRVHLVDGTFELYRAHFSPRRRGLAVAALAEALLFLLGDASEAVTHLAIAFDNPIRSFRNDLFAGYKSDEGVPPELRAQFDLAEEASRALGVVVWSMDTFEADDALATAAARFAGEASQVRILTPDKDLGQSLQGKRVVQVDRIRKKEIDEETMTLRRGVTPAQIPDLLALVGDAADGIPGILGFGEKTAAAVLEAFGTIEAIPARAVEWPAGLRGRDRLAPGLAAAREEALLYKQLATLRTDVPLAESLDDLRWTGVDGAAFEALVERLAAPGLRGKVPPVRA